MLESILTGGISVPSFLICIGAAIALGLLTALVFTFRSRHTASLKITLALLPAAVAVVIMLVNGNIGAGVAVAGAFALVRFRSMPGTAKEIAGIFIAMAIGLACGMGYVVLAALFFAVMAAVTLVLTVSGFAGGDGERHLKITIPENLDYEGIFDDALDKYTTRRTLDKVRTTNMGTLYELSYTVCLRDAGATKAFLDELRCRNGNLTVSLGRAAERDTL